MIKEVILKMTKARNHLGIPLIKRIKQLKKLEEETRRLNSQVKMIQCHKEIVFSKETFLMISRIIIMERESLMNKVILRE